MTKTADRLGVGSEGTASSAGREATWFAGRHAEIGVSDRGVPLVSHKFQKFVPNFFFFYGFFTLSRKVQIRRFPKKYFFWLDLVFFRIPFLDRYFTCITVFIAPEFQNIRF